MLSRISQRNKTTYDITYMWNPKSKDTNELVYKTEILTDIENKHMITKGERGEV